MADYTKTVHGSSYDYISPLKLDLAGRYFVVTGAAFDTGVGYATATALARGGAAGIAMLDLHGVDDALVIRLEKAAVDAGRPKPTIIGLQCDITDSASVEAARIAVHKAFDGKLDCVVNNAAAQESSGTILTIDPETYWRTWEVNVRGLFNMTRSFLPVLLANKANGLCTIINVASSGGLEPRANGASYRSSKTAVIRWTENLQLDHAPDGLLTYCINPGAIKTEITRHLPDAIRDRLPHSPDIAGDTIVWLASERREWLAGRYVSCPWDMEALEGAKEDVVEGDKLKLRLKV